MVKRIRRNIRIEEGVDMLVRELAKEKGVSCAAIYRTLILRSTRELTDDLGYWKKGKLGDEKDTQRKG